MTNLTRYFSLIFVFLFVLSSCKSTQVATDGALEAGAPSMEEEAAEFASVSKESSMASELIENILLLVEGWTILRLSRQ